MPVFYNTREWHITEKISVRKLKKTLKNIKGTHDFTTFCANIKENENRIRTITGIKVRKKKHFIFIHIRGYAFLHKMIRMIVGSAINIVQSDAHPSQMEELLKKQGNTDKTVKVAPPTGLYLYRVTY